MLAKDDRHLPWGRHFGLEVDTRPLKLVKINGWFQMIHFLRAILCFFSGVNMLVSGSVILVWLNPAGGS